MAGRRLWEFCAKCGSGLGVGLSGTNDGILMYHSIGERFGNPSGRHVSVEEFRQQLQLFAANSTIVPLDELLSESVPGQKRLALTFDDGYRNFLTEALPVLRRYEMPVTLFVAPEKIGTNWQQSTYNRPSTMLDWDELHSLADNPLVQIGNHSLTHVALPTLRDDEIRREVNQAKTLLENRLGIQVDTFCYPGGKHNEIVRDIVGETHSYAVTVEPGLNPTETDPLTLPRVNGGRQTDVVAWELSDYGNSLRKLYERFTKEP